MDMDGMGSDSSTSMGMSMFFFTSTTTPLYSEAWTPASAGAYAGTCIFLIILAILLRALITAKTFLEYRTLQKAMKRRYVVTADQQTVTDKAFNDANSMTGILTTNGLQENVRIVEAPARYVQPFRFSVDLPRAVIMSLAAGVGYLLRGFDDDKATGGPCGGFDTPSSARTEFPLSGAPVQLDMHHTQTKLAVYLALGNNPSADDFTITLVPTLSEEGPSNFCLGSVNIPSNLNISAGTNGTIQVVSNGDPSGGLYQVGLAFAMFQSLIANISKCGDVTFINNTLSSSDYNSHCQNSTNVKVTQENMSGQPNGTTSGGSSPSSSTGSSPSSTPGAATHATAGTSWILGAAGVAAFALL
ncbi:hypothetical protein SLS60_004914 [Paraconiothyrium brasiliense]|uniref:Copper transport protein n=1 Tax=Paraconiothyrium brasiliense TaxID=300254 RepID=A0ABR3RLN0_9PLEO